MLTNEAKQRARDLLNAMNPGLKPEDRWSLENIRWHGPALALAQLCQDISDAVEVMNKMKGGRYMPLDHFVLTKPAPDPLEEQRRIYEQNHAELAEKIADGKRWLASLEALAKTGHKIVEAGA